MTNSKPKFGLNQNIWFVDFNSQLPKQGKVYLISSNITSYDGGKRSIFTHFYEISSLYGDNILYVRRFEHEIFRTRKEALAR